MTAPELTTPPAIEPRRLVLTGIRWPHAIAMLALFAYGVFGAWHPVAFWPLHGVDLLIHEFGHLLFAIFNNEVVTILGGSVLQVFVPLACAVYFIFQRDRFSAAVVLFWLAQSIFDVVIYMRDALELVLPLVSMGDGDAVIHDWNYLFELWGVLPQAMEIANSVALIGWGLLVLSLLVGLGSSLTTEYRAVPRRREEFSCVDYTKGTQE